MSFIELITTAAFALACVAILGALFIGAAEV